MADQFWREVRNRPELEMVSNVRFLRKILPGDTLEIHAKLASERVEKAIATCAAEIYNHGELAATGEVTLAMR